MRFPRTEGFPRIPRLSQDLVAQCVNQARLILDSIGFNFETSVQERPCVFTPPPTLLVTSRLLNPLICTSRML